MKKICHFTSVHEPLDDRIFLKECISLKKEGYDVYIVAKGDSFEKDGIKIVGIGEQSGGRIKRFFVYSRKAYKMAKSLNCDLYHFHDPELLPYGLKFKKLGKTVIFDSHENVPAQIQDKEWIPERFRETISNLYKKYETLVAKKIDAVIVSTPYIAGQFKERARKIEIIKNYPRIDDIIFHDVDFNQKEDIACYAGGINEARGERIMIEATDGIDAKLILAGPKENTDYPGLNIAHVEYTGVLDRKEVNELYGKAVLGLVLLLPKKNYIDSLPIKMFEYMAAGIPFVASDFPLWKEIVEKTQAGICVDINNIKEIKATIKNLLENREKAREMGKRGREAVTKYYNWNNEAKKLAALYRDLLNS